MKNKDKKRLTRAEKLAYARAEARGEVVTDKRWLAWKEKCKDEK